MPFRRLRIRKYVPWLVPGYTIISVVLSAVWSWEAFDTVGGFSRATPGVRIFIFGFVGIALFNVFSCVITIAVTEDHVEDAVSRILDRLIPPPIVADIAHVLDERSKGEEVSDGPHSGISADRERSSDSSGDGS